VLVWAVAVRAGSLPGPFGSGWQHLGATYSIIARNHLRYGLLETRFAPVVNAEPAPREEWVHFSHHPPGMGLTTAAAMALLGDRPLAVKLHGLLFSLLQVAVTFALVARALSPHAGLAAALMPAVLPAGAHYATHGSDLGPQAIALALLALLLDERARERDPARPRSGAVLGAAAASLFFGWPALVVVGAIGLRDLLRRDLARAALFFAVVPAAFGLHLLHVRWSTGSFAGDRGGSLLDSFLGHGVVGATSLFAEVGGERVLSRAWRHAQFLFTDSGLVLAGLGLVALVVRAAGDPRARQRLAGPFFGTLALAAGYSIPFARAVLVHRFWLIVALPWIALLIGGLADAVLRLAGGTPPPRTAERGRTVLSALAPVAVAAGLLLLAIHATRADLAAQDAERTPFYEELGTALRAASAEHEVIHTTEHVNGSLHYYAQRRLRGDLDDRQLSSLAAKGAELPLFPGRVAIAQPSFDPQVADCDELLSFLSLHYEGERIDLPRSGRTLRLFDLSRRPEARGASGGR
jgi:hypothetical protein